MPFNISIPLNNEANLEFSVDVGEMLFVLGANGTGKSSLIQRLYSAHRHRERVVEAALRQELMSRLPKRSDIAAGRPIEVRIDVAGVVADERARLENYCEMEDLGSIVARYPIRETGALVQIADRLGFKSRGQYEESVRKMLMDDPDSLAFMQGLFGTLTTDIAAA